MCLGLGYVEVGVAVGARFENMELNSVDFGWFLLCSIIGETFSTDTAGIYMLLQSVAQYNFY